MFEILVIYYLWFPSSTMVECSARPWKNFQDQPWPSLVSVFQNCYWNISNPMILHFHSPTFLGSHPNPGLYNSNMPVLATLTRIVPYIHTIFLFIKYRNILILKYINNHLIIVIFIFYGIWHQQANWWN